MYCINLYPLQLTEVKYSTICRPFSAVLSDHLPWKFGQRRDKKNSSTTLGCQSLKLFGRDEISQTSRSEKVGEQNLIAVSPLKISRLAIVAFFFFLRTFRNPNKRPGWYRSIISTISTHPLKRSTQQIRRFSFANPQQWENRYRRKPGWNWLNASTWLCFSEVQGGMPLSPRKNRRVWSTFFFSQGPTVRLWAIEVESAGKTSRRFQKVMVLRVQVEDLCEGASFLNDQLAGELDFYRSKLLCEAKCCTKPGGFTNFAQGNFGEWTHGTADSGRC